MSHPTILALALLLCASAVRADDAPEDQPEHPRPASSSVNTVGGSHRNVEDRGSGASAVNWNPASGQAPKGNLTKFAGFSALPKWRGQGQAYLDFGSTVGSGFAVRFQAVGGDGSWAFVEDVGSTDACFYLAWISAAPGGPALKGGGKGMNACGYRTTMWTGGNLFWRGGGKSSPWECPLDAGREYYFNIMLQTVADGRGPCREHLSPQGTSQGLIFKQ